MHFTVYLQNCRIVWSISTSTYRSSAHTTIRSPNPSFLLGFVYFGDGQARTYRLITSLQSSPTASKVSQPPKAHLLRRPIFRIQSVKPDFPASGRRMHKAATSDIDASVRGDVALGKDDKVTRTNVFTRYRQSPSLQHKHSPRWCNTCSRAVHVTN